MKNLKLEEKNQLSIVRNKVYDNISNTYIFTKDKFVQQIIKEAYKATKKELMTSLFHEWILENQKISKDDFFMFFEKKFRADLQNMNYTPERKIIYKTDDALRKGDIS